jgi:hypothetical protein
VSGSSGAVDLDVYDIAYLAGGPARVVDTALVALVRSGRVRVHSPGRFAAVGLTRRHPVEAAVLDAIGTGGHRSIDTILWRLVDDERLLHVEDRLRQEGLLRRGRWLGRHAPDRRLLVRTIAGRQVLRRLIADPPANAGDAVPVALRGRAGLADRELSAAVFDGPRQFRPLHRGSRSSNRAEAAAEAWQDRQLTHGVLATTDNYFAASSGPTAPRLGEPRRTRGSK